MARARYIITNNDQSAAWLHICNKLDEVGYPKRNVIAAKSAFEVIRQGQSLHCRLNEWAEQYLDKEEWGLLKNSIRARRSRGSRDRKKSITLDKNAWQMLSKIAETENVTLSQVIEKHLKDLYLDTLKLDRIT